MASRGLFCLLAGATSCVSFSLVPDESSNSRDGGAASRDGGPDDGDAVADGDAASKKTTFILKAKVAGALATTPEAALAAADALCGREFVEATGRQALFVAWLGTKDHPVLDRFGTSRGPWYLPSGQRVARSLSDLA